MRLILKFLLQPHQLRDNRIIVNDASRAHLDSNGGQGKHSIIVEGVLYALSFDGWKMYLTCELPTHDDMKRLRDKEYKLVIIISRFNYNPAK